MGPKQLTGWADALVTALLCLHNVVVACDTPRPKRELGKGRVWWGRNTGARPFLISMVPSSKLKALQSELAFIEGRLATFSAPHLSDNAPPLSPEEDLLHELLRNRRAAIMAELVKVGVE